MAMHSALPNIAVCLIVSGLLCSVSSFHLQHLESKSARFSPSYTLHQLEKDQLRFREAETKKNNQQWLPFSWTSMARFYSLGRKMEETVIGLPGQMYCYSVL